MERRESGGWKEEYLSEVSIVLKRTVNQNCLQPSMFWIINCGVA